MSGKVSVHDGFLEAIDPVWDDISKTLEEVKCPIFYTGHSLGAALATLAAARSRVPQALYTFGSPLVGNQAFVDTLNNVAIYRVVDDEDLVTVVPPEILGFRHVGELHKLKPLVPETLTPLELKLKELALSVLNLPPISFKDFDLEFPPKILADHAPINYIERLT